MEILNSLIAGPYNIAFVVALGTAFCLAIRAGRADGHPRLAWAVLITGGATLGLVGSKLLIFDFQPVTFGEKSNLGGIAIGVLAVVAAARVLGLGALRSLDSVTVPTVVAMAIGRVGCFIAGCCKGTATDLPWGVQYTGDVHRIHPVQLYEAGADVLLIAALLRFAQRGRSGTRLFTAIAGYSAIRFATEFVREGREIHSGLNYVQWSVLLFGLGAVLAVLRLRNGDDAVAAWGIRGTGAGHERRPDDSVRALPAALGLVAMLVGLVVVFPRWLTPLEATTVLAAAAALASFTLFTNPAPHGVVRLVPTVGALLMHPPVTLAGGGQGGGQDRAKERPSRELVLGFAATSAEYSRRVGFTAPYTDSCDGSYRPGSPIVSGRRSETKFYSLGVRNTTASGTRVTLSGDAMAGRDRVDYAPQDATFTRNPSFRVNALGAGVLIEHAGHAVEFRAMNGTFASDGTPSHSTAVSGTIRVGARKGFFVETGLADRSVAMATGKSNYVGVGFSLGEFGARFMVGAGDAPHVGMFVPIGPVELTLQQTGPQGSVERLKVGPMTTVGVRTAIRMR